MKTLLVGVRLILLGLGLWTTNVVRGDEDTERGKQRPAKEGSMKAFMSRVRDNAVSYSDRTLQYQSGVNSLQVSFGGKFQVNGTVVDTEYGRFDSPYASSPRKPRTQKIAHGKHVLELDYYGQKRASR